MENKKYWLKLETCCWQQDNNGAHLQLNAAMNQNHCKIKFAMQNRIRNFELGKRMKWWKHLLKENDACYWFRFENILIENHQHYDGLKRFNFYCVQITQWTTNTFLMNESMKPSISIILFTLCKNYRSWAFGQISSKTLNKLSNFR